MYKTFLLVGILVLMFSIGTADAVMFTWDFEIFTDNGDYNDDPGGDFYFELLDEGALARFEFHNDSSFDSTITHIYFDVGSLSSISGFDSPAGVSFSAGASPPNLPSGNTVVPPFMTTPGLSARADNPAPQNGVNPTEWVAILMVMNGGTTVADINNELISGDLRVGVHIQNLLDGSSEAAVNVPEPSLVVLVLLGGLALVRKMRR